MEKDPVSGMQVDPAKGAVKNEFRGKARYFCNPAQTKFEASAEEYVSW